MKLGAWVFGIVLTGLLCLPLAGATSPSQKIQLRKLAESHWLNQALLGLPATGTRVKAYDSCDPNQPPPPGESCVSAACNRMPPYHCDDVSEVKNIAQWCRGAPNGHCLNSVCNRFPSYQCDDPPEIKQVIDQCRGFNNGECLNVACGKMPAYHCDDFTEVSRLMNACRGLADPSCIENLCSRLPAYQCDEPNELIEVITACK